MIKIVIIYLLFVSDYQQCATKQSLKCQQIKAYCPNVKHYDYIRSTKQLEHEANMCYMTAQRTKLLKDYEKRVQGVLK